MKLENVADVYPLSPMQEGMLFHTVSDPGQGVYVDQVVVTLVGAIDCDRLVRSYRRICPRFDAHSLWPPHPSPMGSPQKEEDSQSASSQSTC